MIHSGKTKQNKHHHTHDQYTSTFINTLTATRVHIVSGLDVNTYVTQAHVMTSPLTVA